MLPEYLWLKLFDDFFVVEFEFQNFSFVVSFNLIHWQLRRIQKYSHIHKQFCKRNFLHIDTAELAIKTFNSILCALTLN